MLNQNKTYSQDVVLDSSITRSELIELLALKFPQLLPKDVELVVKTLLDSMTNALVQGKRIELRGVGSFVLHHRPARVGRNPKSGAQVMIPEKKIPHFKPGKELRERVDYNASVSTVPSTSSE
ncbi:integration host factor subunit beta [Polynucleobacter rarus]|jgi:integration host factor subunit beta|uniref:integration host factor subunit beta n=1 Tax=Polynucleobacter rarus TaxID=556055 RepID=UPI000D3E0AB9|nr:integration host factor subunit beta [Polynucleobacter rarus]